eukprot:SAG22_NODE_175_length_16235_cov_67.112729_9_plen_65_part_00
MGCGASSGLAQFAGEGDADGGGGGGAGQARVLGVLQRGMRANELNELQAAADAATFEAHKLEAR